jgi:hypothetical protein
VGERRPPSMTSAVARTKWLQGRAGGRAANGEQARAGAMGWETAGGVRALRIRRRVSRRTRRGGIPLCLRRVPLAAHPLAVRAHEATCDPIRPSRRGSRACAHTRACPRAHAHTYARARTHTHPRRHARTHTHTHMRARTHTHTWANPPLPRDARCLASRVRAALPSCGPRQPLPDGASMPRGNRRLAAAELCARETQTSNGPRMPPATWHAALHVVRPRVRARRGAERTAGRAAHAGSLATVHRRPLGCRVGRCLAALRLTAHCCSGTSRS